MRWPAPHSAPSTPPPRSPPVLAMIVAGSGVPGHGPNWPGADAVGVLVRAAGVRHRRRAPARAHADVHGPAQRPPGRTGPDGSGRDGQPGRPARPHPGRRAPRAGRTARHGGAGLPGRDQPGLGVRARKGAARREPDRDAPPGPLGTALADAARPHHRGPAAGAPYRMTARTSPPTPPARPQLPRFISNPP